eukprot:Amastigsp_a676848_41.p4 type:complete len:136 gc:universal Amastigsp_a676848_41:625-218(-)
MWNERSPGARTTTRDFSKRYCWMLPPSGVPTASKSSSMYLPNRELLSLRSVLALPNASRIGFDSMSLVLIRSASAVPLETCAMYRMKILDASVLPAPDSPVITTHWFVRDDSSERNVSSASANTCGGTSYMNRPR